MFIRIVLFGSALYACRVDDPPVVSPEPTPGTTPSQTDQLADAFIQNATQGGFHINEGLFAFVTYEHCCEPDVNCLGNNPSTPYGLIALPPAPEQEGPDLDSFWMWGTLPQPGLTRSYRLRPDEAYVWIGTLPPRSKYFSYRSSIATRQDPAGQRNLVLGSLGPSLNQLTILSDIGGSDTGSSGTGSQPPTTALPTDRIWGRTAVLVTAADAAIESLVIQWLAAAGVAPDEIHLDRISAVDARLGLQPEADTLMGVMRVAIPDDVAAFEDWQRTGARVLRITPPQDRATTPFGRQPLPERGGEGTELPWLLALRDLEQAIRAHWPELTPREPERIFGFTETFDCIEDLSCTGDIRDRYASRTLDVALPDDDAFIVVFGTNHERTGKSVYSNFSVMTYDNRVGVLTVESSQMPGSARYWLGDEYPLVDDLYAWIVSRDCTRFEMSCLEVQDTCPHPEPGEDFYITSRMYLDPNTGVAPGDGEMILDRVLEFGVTP